MNIDELKELMKNKSDDELLGMLSRRNLYSPNQIDVAIEILKSRKADIKPEETEKKPDDEDDPTTFFKPIKDAPAADSDETKNIKEETEVKKADEGTAKLPEISNEYINMRQAEKIKEKAPEKKKNSGFIISMAAAVVIIVAALCFIFRPGVFLFKSKFEKGDMNGAQKVYTWCSKSYSSLNKIKSFLKSEVNENIEAFLDGKISYEDAEEKILQIKLFDEELADKYLEELSNAQNANSLFEEGKAFMENKDYYNAIISFQGIYEGFKEHDNIVKYIENCKTKLKQEADSRLQEFLESNDFQGAMDYMNKISSIFEDDSEVAAWNDAVAEKYEAQQKRSKSAEDYYNNGGSVDNNFRDQSGLTTPVKKLVTWNETGTKAVIEYGTVGSKSQLAFAVYADIGSGLQEVYNYNNAVYNIYYGTISEVNGRITVVGKINTKGVFDTEADLSEVTYTLKFDGNKAYLN